MRQVRLGPVITELGAEHARRRPAPIGIVRHPFGKAASRRQSVGVRIDSVPNVALSGHAGKHKHRARGGIATTTAAAGGTRRYTGTYPPSLPRSGTPGPRSPNCSAAARAPTMQS